MADATFKVCIFGDGGVGKTALTRRYLDGVFTENTAMTIGIDFHSKVMSIEGLTIHLQIWDFAGESRFRFLLPDYARGAMGGIFMYDLTRYSSLKNVDDWLNLFGTKTENGVPIIMVGGKSDLKEKRCIPRHEGIEIALERGVSAFVECSAQTGENVEAVFENLTELMMKRAELID